MCISMKYVKLQRVIKGIFILCNEIYQELVRGGGGNQTDGDKSCIKICNTGISIKCQKRGKYERLSDQNRTI